MNRTIACCLVLGLALGCNEPSGRHGNTELVAAAATAQAALFVVGNTTLTTADAAFKQRLEGAGLTVVVKSAGSVSAADAAGKALVVVSSTVDSAKVGTKFRNVTVPVLTWESAIYDDMGMTSSNGFGTNSGQTKLTMLVPPSDPMAAGLSGTPTVTTSTNFSWGKPTSGAVRVARLASDSTKAVIFRYEKGAAMVNLFAPERRVGFFFSDLAAGRLTDAGKQLTDAAIRWAARLPVNACATSADGAPCDDGNSCTSNDRCAGGACAGTPVTCVPSDACHDAGTCNPATGTCGAGPSKPDGSACSDGNACTSSDSCTSGVCTGTTVTCASVDECHLPGVCDPATGSCSAGPARPDGTSCGDGSSCTSSDSCQSGVCVGTPVVCAAVDQCHLPGMCDPSTGSCAPGPARPDGTSCTDGNSCTLADSCQSGVCAGSPITCAPTDQCHVAGTCDPATGACLAGMARPDGTSCADGNSCTLADTCQSGACLGTPVTCAPVDQCHDQGVCDPATGSCAAGPPLSDGTSCADGNSCTSADSCQSGVCVGAPVGCAPIDQCHLAGVCDPATGTCSDGPPQPDGISCGDGNSCTTSDVCQSGLCVGAPISCAPADPCHFPGDCDPATGSCSAGAARPDGTSCSDGNSCTSGDACQSGVCTGAPVGCAPADQCHLSGVCDPATGACSDGPPQPDGTSCSDGNSCTSGDTCQLGICGGAPLVCAPVDECHLAGACDPATGVCSVGPPQPDGTMCGDGNSCTSSDVCQAGLCVGAPISCAPADQCHLAGVCDPATGSCSAGAPRPDGTSCSDGNSCTLGDLCQSGLCAGAPVACAPTDQCHLPGACDPATGTCSAGPASPDGTACSDGNGCTSGDTCQGGSCVGSPVTCPPVDSCHLAGTCNAITGTCAPGPARPDGTSCNDGSLCTVSDSCSAGVCSGFPIACAGGLCCKPATGQCGLCP